MSPALYDRCIVTHAALRVPRAAEGASRGAAEAKSGATPPHPAARPNLPSVGLLLGDGPLPRVTVLVKLTLDISADPAFIADTQARLSAGTLAADSDLLRYPSDFVAEKHCCDVMVVGAAYAEQPAREIAGAIEVSGVRAAFVAMAGAPAPWIPLCPPYLCAPGGETPVYLGPGRTGRGIEGAAHPDLQVPSVAPDAAIALVGLSPRAYTRTVRLPGLAPRALVMATWGAQEARLACDTLWIDTEAERAVLVWRGAVAAAQRQALDVQRVAVSLELAGAARPWPEILRGQQGGVLLRPDTEARAKEQAPLSLDPDEAALRAMSTWTAAPPDPRLPPEAHARIAAALTAPGASRPQVLAEHGLSESDWALEERAWAEALATRPGPRRSARRGAAAAMSESGAAAAASGAAGAPARAEGS